MRSFEGKYASSAFFRELVQKSIELLLFEVKAIEAKCTI